MPWNRFSDQDKLQINSVIPTDFCAHLYLTVATLSKIPLPCIQLIALKQTYKSQIANL